MSHGARCDCEARGGSCPAGSGFAPCGERGGLPPEPRPGKCPAGRCCPCRSRPLRHSGFPGMALLDKGGGSREELRQVVETELDGWPTLLASPIQGGVGCCRYI